MKYRDVYKAACTVVARAESEHGSNSDEYKKAVAGLQDIASFRCIKCVGFGWNNANFGGHALELKGHSESRACVFCNGSGFAPQ